MGRSEHGPRVVCGISVCIRLVGTRQRPPGQSLGEADDRRVTVGGCVRREASKVACSLRGTEFTYAFELRILGSFQCPLTTVLSKDAPCCSRVGLAVSPGAFASASACLAYKYLTASPYFGCYVQHKC